MLSLTIRYALFAAAFLAFIQIRAQVNSLELDPKLEKMYAPYLTYRHQGQEGLEEFKRNHPHEYLKELWYYSSSFSVKRNHFSSGDPLDESTIDISRFEQYRKDSDTAMVVLDGYKDVLLLLPSNKLIFKFD